MKSIRFFSTVAAVFIMIFMIQYTASAFPFTIAPLSASAVSELSNEKLIQAYIDAAIEVETVGKFYENAGFTPKELGRYRDLLYYRTSLITELNRRGIPIPQIK